MFCLSYGKVFSQFSLVLAVTGNQIGQGQGASTECQSKWGSYMVFSLCCLSLHGRPVLAAGEQLAEELTRGGFLP